jgi:hypothetical protein
MSNTLELQTIISENCNELITQGYDPIDIAATLVVIALSVYGKQLSPDTYTEVIDHMVLMSPSFIDPNNRILQ